MYVLFGYREPFAMILPTLRRKILHAAALICGVFISITSGQSESPLGEVSNCQPSIPIQSPATVQGNLIGPCTDSEGSFVKIYKFNAFAENDEHWIEVSSDAFIPTVRTYASTGALIGTGTRQGNAVRLYHTNLAGTYYIFVGAQNPSTGGAYQITYHRNVLDAWPLPRINFDGYSGADRAIYRPAENRWVIRTSDGQSTSMVWGIAGDKLVPADYDGDGKTDIAIFRPSTGVWYIVESQTGAFRTVAWGQDGDIPITSSDHYAKTDFVIFRPSEGRWYIRRGRDDQILIVDWGQAGDIPVYQRFSGYGGFEFAVFRPSEGRWYLRLSYPDSIRTVDWGQAGDIPVAADYDGDGRADIAVYRPTTGQWFLIKSRYNDIQVTQWGEPGDIPVPDDFRYDTRADLALFRPSNGRWYIVSFDLFSSFSESFQFGEPGDLPALAHQFMR